MPPREDRWLSCGEAKVEGEKGEGWRAGVGLREVQLEAMDEGEKIEFWREPEEAVEEVLDEVEPEWGLP